MSFLMLALLVAFACAAALVLADSALRLWSAMGGLAAQRSAVTGGFADLPQLRSRAARVSTRVSYAPAARNAGLRAAA